jgi:hypothetical protein
MILIFTSIFVFVGIDQKIRVHIIFFFGRVQNIFKYICILLNIRDLKFLKEKYVVKLFDT